MRRRAKARVAITMTQPLKGPKMGAFYLSSILESSVWEYLLIKDWGMATSWQIFKA